MASSRRSGTNENISTFGDGTRDYTDLNTWEAATDNDLVTATTSEVLECYADSSSYAQGQGSLAGATTNSSYFRIIRPVAAARHGGIPGAGIVFAFTTTFDAWGLGEQWSQIQDIEGRITSSGDRVWNINSNNGRLIGLIASCGGASSTGFVISNSRPGRSVVDCLALDCGTAGFSVTPGDASRVYNCTAVNCGDGFTGTGTGVVINCLAALNTTDFAGTWGAASTNNAAEDGTAPGANAQSGLATFVNSAGDDYHLASGDTVCRGNGADLSADASYAFDDDVDFDTRSAWDIGFDEFVSAGGFSALAGSFSAITALSAAIRGRAAASGTSAAVSAFGAGIRAGGGLSGAISAQTNLGAGGQGTGNMSGTAGIEAMFAGALAGPDTRIAGAWSAAAAFAAAMLARGNMAAGWASVANFSGAMNTGPVTLAIAGSWSAGATFSGSIRGLVRSSATWSATTAFGGALAGRGAMPATWSATTAFSAAMRADAALSAAWEIVTTFSGTMVQPAIAVVYVRHGAVVLLVPTADLSTVAPRGQVLVTIPTAMLSRG